MGFFQRVVSGGSLLRIATTTNPESSEHGMPREQKLLAASKIRHPAGSAKHRFTGHVRRLAKRYMESRRFQQRLWLRDRTIA